MSPNTEICIEKPSTTLSERGQHAFNDHDFLLSQLVNICESRNEFEKDSNPSVSKIFIEYTILVASYLHNIINLYVFFNFPKGIINLGTASNKIMDNEIQDRFNHGDLLNFESPKHQHYYDFTGIPSLRNAFVNFFRKFMGATDSISAQEVSIT